MIPNPHPDTVRNVAFLLSAMTPERAGDGIVKIMEAISAGAVGKGWTEAEAKNFATRFGLDVAAAIGRLASAHPTGVH